MIINKFFKFSLILISTTAASVLSDDVPVPVWGYNCIDKNCVKVLYRNDSNIQSLSKCKMLCGGREIETLWPKPTGPVQVGTAFGQISRESIKFKIIAESRNDTLWQKVKSRFRAKINAKIPKSSFTTTDGKPFLIKIEVEDLASDVPKLDYETDESYTLNVTQGKKQILANVKAKTFYGARHGLETLTQLVVFDDLSKSLQALTGTKISDAPVYKHRGLMLDTARHYFSMKSILRVIDGMAMTKLNAFHWHITDTNSFPLVVDSHPDLHTLGAYAQENVYTREDIAKVVEYANIRGVRVIPELDGPAHTGEGWQMKNMTVCFNAQPWEKFCSQPPCGQLDPTIEEVYSVLKDIYREMFAGFDPNIFHMGGDTISIACWNSSETIRQYMLKQGWQLELRDFSKLWQYFHINALESLDTVSTIPNVPIILWSSELAADSLASDFLDKSRYIIETVGNADISETSRFLNKGFRMISTSNDLVVKSGTSNWIGGSRTDGWQKFYEHRPDQLLGGSSELILGAEAAVWSEQVDQFTLDGQLWPKASALAERLWSNPKENWQDAENRLLAHRQALFRNGIAAESLQPEWCIQNPNSCKKISV